MTIDDEPTTQRVGASRLLRLGEVAEQLAISRSMAHKLVACGQIPSVRIGRAVRVRPLDLEAYLASVTQHTD